MIYSVISNLGFGWRYLGCDLSTRAISTLRRPQIELSVLNLEAVVRNLVKWPSEWPDSFATLRPSSRPLPPSTRPSHPGACRTWLSPSQLPTESTIRQDLDQPLSIKHCWHSPIVLSSYFYRTFHIFLSLFTLQLSRSLVNKKYFVAGLSEPLWL